MASFVRESHFRHVYGDETSLDSSYTDVKAACNGDGNHIKVNQKFFVVAKKAGGGPVMVHPIAQQGRIPLDRPTINIHSAKVLDFDFCPSDNNILATGSDDCTVKIVKFPDEITKNIDTADATLNGHAKKIAFVK